MMGHGARGLALLVLALATCAGCTLLSGPPAAEFDVSPLVVYAGDQIELDASPSAGEIVAYRWDVGGSVEHGRTLTTSFARAGVYMVRLTVEDGEGRTASAEREVTVYVRSGTRLFSESFGDGDSALGRWPLDPTWAVQGEGEIESISGGPGYVLYVNSGRETLHRRSAKIELPPLRVGQRLVFSVRVMPLQTQDFHGFFFGPGRSSMEYPPAGLPYYVYSSSYGSSSVHEPSVAGGELTHPAPFVPSVYEWHTIVFSYTAESYELSADGNILQTGIMEADPSRGGPSWLALGDESLTEGCQAYFDDLVVSVEE